MRWATSSAPGRTVPSSGLQNLECAARIETPNEHQASLREVSEELLASADSLYFSVDALVRLK